MFDDPSPGDTVVFTLEQLASPSGFREALRLSKTYKVVFRDEAGQEYALVRTEDKA